MFRVLCSLVLGTEALNGREVPPSIPTEKEQKHKFKENISLMFQRTCRNFPVFSHTPHWYTTSVENIKWVMFIKEWIGFYSTRDLKKSPLFKNTDLVQNWFLFKKPKYFLKKCWLSQNDCSMGGKKRAIFQIFQNKTIIFGIRNHWNTLQTF